MATFKNTLLTNSTLTTGTVRDLLLNPKGSTTFTGTRIVGASNIKVKHNNLKLITQKDTMKFITKPNVFKVSKDIKIIKGKLIFTKGSN